MLNFKSWFCAEESNPQILKYLLAGSDTYFGLLGKYEIVTDLTLSRLHESWSLAVPIISWIGGWLQGSNDHVSSLVLFALLALNIKMCSKHQHSGNAMMKHFLFLKTSFIDLQLRNCFTFRYPTFSLPVLPHTLPSKYYFSSKDSLKCLYKSKSNSSSKP